MKKKVVFASSVKNPKITQKCECCNFRSIPPRTREFFICSACKKKVCHHCINSTAMICADHF